MAVHLVSSIDAPDFGSLVVRIGDLDGDGAPDLLFAQSVYGPREIRCLTATTIGGQRLWQVGTPSAEFGRIYSDLPVQIYDWDNDGCNEVLYIRPAEYLDPQGRPCPTNPEHTRERGERYGGQATMVVLDGRTGREKTSFPLPPPADDCIVLADLTGRGRREDFVVKDRYWNMWGVSGEGRVLWQWTGATGHYPAVADVDGDGCDEVFIGYALIDHDGRVLFDHHTGREEPGVHSDANYAVQLPDGRWRLLFGNGGVHCLDVAGQELWSHKITEAQHVLAGRFRTDSALQVAVIDRGYPRTPEGRPADLYLFDLETGREIWRRPQPTGCWSAECMDIRWTGRPHVSELLVRTGLFNPDVIYDGDGNVIERIDVPSAYCATYREHGGAGNPGAHYLMRADVWGDSRDEVILAGSKGVRIYANTRALPNPTLYNATFYHGQ